MHRYTNYTALVYTEGRVSTYINVYILACMMLRIIWGKTWTCSLLWHSARSPWILELRTNTEAHTSTVLTRNELSGNSYRPEREAWILMVHLSTSIPEECIIFRSLSLPFCGLLVTVGCFFTQANPVAVIQVEDVCTT